MKNLKMPDIDKYVAEWSKPFKCSRCTLEGDYELTDIRESPEYDQREPAYFYIICPLCQRQIAVSFNDKMAEFIWQKIQRG